MRAASLSCCGRAFDRGASKRTCGAADRDQGLRGRASTSLSGPRRLQTGSMRPQAAWCPRGPGGEDADPRASVLTWATPTAGSAPAGPRWLDHRRGAAQTRWRARTRSHFWAGCASGLVSLRHGSPRLPLAERSLALRQVRPVLGCEGKEGVVEQSLRARSKRTHLLESQPDAPRLLHPGERATASPQGRSTRRGHPRRRLARAFGGFSEGDGLRPAAVTVRPSVPLEIWDTVVGGSLRRTSRRYACARSCDWGIPAG